MWAIYHFLSVRSQRRSGHEGVSLSICHKPGNRKVRYLRPERGTSLVIGVCSNTNNKPQKPRKAESRTLYRSIARSLADCQYTLQLVATRL